MHFMKSVVILIKVDEIYNISKSARNCLLLKRSGADSGWSEGSICFLHKVKHCVERI